MLKIVYPICCGIDVHKTFVVACIASTNSKGVTTYQSKRFSSYTRNLRELSAWLGVNDCKDVCMESTGKYWHPVWNILEFTFVPSWLTQSISRPFAARKPIRRTLNGSRMCSSMVWYRAVLFHQPKSENCVIFCVTGSN